MYSINPESIKPGQNASLTGPSQSILAIGNFTIKLLLTDKDTWSWDDEIVNKDISWDASEIGNVYDKPIFQELVGKNGSVTVNYAVLRNAVAARITVTLEQGGESTPNVYGQVYAHYDNWEDDPKTTCLLFNRSSADYVDVRRWQAIPLLRSVVAVPLDGSLIVKASLYDYDTLSGDDEIADGAVEFPAQMSCTSSEEIKGEDGNYLQISTQGTEFLGFNGSYNRLSNAAGLSMEEVRVGFYNLGHGINQLATSTTGEIRARYLIVMIMMICESTRLIPISNYMATNFDNSHGSSSDDYNNYDNRNREGQIQQWISTLVRDWGAFSAALLRADAYPDESFRLRRNVVRLPPDNREIRTIPEAAAILGILLGLCFRHSGPRSNPESMKPGQNASLTGPSQSILAIGNFTIKLLLTDKDTWSWDDEIVNKDISWDASEIGNVYDKPIFQELVGKNGSVTVNYAVLRNAVAATITVTLEQGGESTPNVYGQVYAHYDNWEDDPKTTCLLFNRSSADNVDVRRGQAIQLLRSVVAVPLDGSLIVKASLYDYDTLSGDDEIADGAVEFPDKCPVHPPRKLKEKMGIT
ncbi:hypothetical protein DKX38_026587 [Salix brachista]|uniref:DUF6598 domain-containing protein n=1 Tax=Salix brachista TaxID=2182728 RepID=A0A5N5J9W1_9ROSI|nr:hypothetical protein DKX38_026587 [Salix brachista]